MKKRLVLVIMGVIFIATPSFAGEPSSTSRGGDSGYVGVFFPRITFRGDNQPDTGDGVGVRVGGIKDNVFAAELSAFRTWHDVGPAPKAVFTGITLDFKFSLPLFPVVSPYGLAGLGRYVLENSQTVYRGNQDGSGINGYQVGAGLDFHLSESLSLNVGYTKRRMEFDHGTPGGTEIRKQARTYDFGLAVHF